MKITGEAALLRAKADRTKILADGKDLAFITVEITDKDGRLVPRTNNPIRFSLDGPGEIIATDNGDPTNKESFVSHERSAFNGLVLVIVRSQGKGSGKITVTAESPGLKTAKIEIRSK